MERLFLTVLHMGVNAGYLILVVTAARLLLKKAPKSMICMLCKLMKIDPDIPAQIIYEIKRLLLPEEVSHGK